MRTPATNTTAANGTADHVVFALDPARGAWADSGFSERDAMEWRRAGFTPQDAAVWRCHSFPTPGDAAPWYRIDVPFSTAKMMKTNCVTITQAALWFPNADITPASRITIPQNQRIVSWVAAEVPYDDWVLECVNADISFEDYQNFLAGDPDSRRPVDEIASAVAYDWSVNGFSESVKHSFRGEGVTNASEARAWLTTFKAAGRPLTPRKMLAWKKRGFSAGEAVDWSKAIELTFPHVGDERVTISEKWKGSGYTPFEMYLLSGFLQMMWVPPDRSSRDIVGRVNELTESGERSVYERMYDLGVPEPHTWDVEEVREIRDDIDTGSYLTVNEIADWVSHGFFSLDSALFWKQQGLSPEEADKKISSGN